MPRGTSDLGVYLHIPYCERVCPYCDFAVVGLGGKSLDPEREARYCDALLTELEAVGRAREAELSGRVLSTVYLGGGTPSLLTPGSVERLLGALEARFDSTPAEVTLELNPGPLEAGRAPDFRTASVTRPD